MQKFIRFCKIQKTNIKYIKIDKINKINLHYIKCRKIAVNSTSIELKFGIDRINRLCSSCVDCGHEKITTIDIEELNYYLKNLV